MIVIISIISILAFCFKLYKLYYNANEKHRKEMVQITLFYYNHVFNTPIQLPRAFMPLFSCFEGNFFGISFHGVQTIIYNDLGKLLLGKRTGTRAKKWLYDVGAAGMVAGRISSISDAVHTATEELHEETNLIPCDNQPLEYMMTVTPATGYPCIVHIFKMVVADGTEITSNDGTFGQIEWVDIQFLKNLRSTDGSRLYSKCSELLIKNL
jgi:hypothetical protein